MLTQQCSVRTRVAKHGTSSASSSSKQEGMLHTRMTYRMVDTSSNRIKQNMAVIMAACNASMTGEASTWPRR